MPRPSQERDPESILQEAGWVTGTVWKCAENLAPHWDSIPILTIQPAVSHYTDWAIPAHTVKILTAFIRNKEKPIKLSYAEMLLMYIQVVPSRNTSQDSD